MKYLFLILFAFDALLQVIAILLRREGLRRISKVLLVPLLIGYYILTAEHFLVSALLAGILGWLGDIFLIRGGKNQLFILGLLGFLLGHLAYIRSLLYFTGSVNRIALIIAVIAALPLCFAAFRLIRPAREILIPLLAYALVLEGMAIAAFCLMLYRKDVPALAIFAGSLCFMASDTILGHGLFRSGAHVRDLPVMTSYMAAQACLILGLARL
jgi:uncharacterized membrane protein YhhN